jgi:hypothetical protein
MKEERASKRKVAADFAGSRIAMHAAPFSTGVTR